MCFFLGITIKGSGQTTIWSEDFSAYVEFTGIEGPGVVYIGDYPAGVTKWTLDVSSCTLSNSDDYIKTDYEKLQSQDLDGPAVWLSESIDLTTCSTGATFSIKFYEYSSMEPEDYIDVHYQLDGGDFVLIPNWNGHGSDIHTLIDDFSKDTVVHSVSACNNLAIRVTFNNNSSFEEFQMDDVFLYANMGYASSTTVQNINKIAPNKTNEHIIAIEIETTGSLNPLSISSFTVNPNGSTTPVSNNIENAKIFYTGTDNFFATVNQFGSVYASPTTTNFNIAGTQELSGGTNYFWLTFDTKAGATIGEVVDAECVSFVIDGTTKTPTITAPAGSRTIGVPLSGDYTIGAAGDYTSFTDAANELMALGINAPVTFTVSNGTYTEQILLSTIAGTSATDTVIFQSGSGNRADVVLQYEPTSDPANHILKFNGTDYITFQNMTLNNIGTSAYGRVVVFAGEINNINLTGCNITGRDINEESYDYNVITGESGITNMASNIVFDNDTIRYGSRGLYFRGGDNDNLETGIKISNSVFEDFYSDGIFLYYQDSIVVHRNKITSKGIYDYEYGIYLGYCYGSNEITANMVFLSAEDVNCGIKLYECHASAARYALIANNYFSQVSTGGAYGIDVSDCSYQKIYHNSINMRSSAKGGKGAKFYPTVGLYFDCMINPLYTHIELLNNIVKSSKKVISVTQTAADNNYVSSNHNDLYTTGETLADWGDISCADLAAWYLASGQDGNSVFVDPEFVSSKVPDPLNPDLPRSVPVTTEVVNDIYGKERVDPTTPGAVESDTIIIRDNHWTGLAGDCNWHNPQNWSLYEVPDANHNVFIGGDTYFDPWLMNEDAECNNLTIESDGELYLNENTIKVGGDCTKKSGGELSGGCIRMGGPNNSVLMSAGSDNISIITDKTSKGEVLLYDALTVVSLQILNGNLNANNKDIAVNGDADFSGGSVTNTNEVKFNGDGNSELTTGSNFLESVVVDKDGNAVVTFQDALKAEILTILKGNLDANNKNIEISGDANLENGNLSNDNKITFTGSGNSTVEFNDSYRYNHVETDKDLSTVEVIMTPRSKIYKFKNFTVNNGKVVATGNEVDITGDADYSGGDLDTDKITYTGSSNSTVTPGDGRQENVVVNKDNSNYEVQITPTGKKYKLKAFTIERGTVVAAVTGPLDISGDADLAGGSFNANVTFSETTNSTLTTGTTTMQEVIVDKDGAELSLYDALVAQALTILKGKLDANGNPITADADITVNDGGTLEIDSGATLYIGDDRTFSVNSGGRLDVIGSEGNEAIISRAGSGYFNLDIQSGGTICAKRGIFEFIRAGLYVHNGAYVDTDNSFNNCTFRNSEAGNDLLTINNDQILTLESVCFPENTWGGSHNVSKQIDQGQVTLNDATGSFAGGDYENDPYNRVEWTYTSSIIANFEAEPLEGIAPLSVQFTDLSTGYPITWDWNFGDGNTSSEQNPGHIYEIPGDYTVSLTVTDVASVSDTETKPNYITVLPVGPTADFSAGGTSGDAPLEVTFIDQSIQGTGVIDEWYWNFGDGNSSSDQNPGHIYEIPGDYTVSLTVTDVYDLFDTETKTDYITVVPVGPIADFTAGGSSGNAPLEVTFTDQSIQGTGVIDEWYWNFGDGNSSFVQNQVHVYESPGNYTVSLTVTDAYDLFDTETKTDYITVNLPANQDIDLLSGYQFISTRIIPEDQNMLNILSENLESLDFVRNSAGLMLRKIGPIWVNSIGNWVVTEGYLFRMNSVDELTISGEAIDPQTPIDLITGYQMISFLPENPVNTSDAFDDVLSNLNFVRNSAGLMFRKIGPIWVNGIGDMQPCEGYLVKMNADDVLIYPESTYKLIAEILKSPEHFKVINGNPHDLVWTIYFEQSVLSIGDEIGVYDGEVLTGSSVINSDNILENSIPVFSNLYESGNYPIFKIWSKNGEEEYLLTDYSYINPYGSAYMQDVFPENDGEYSMLNFSFTGISDNLKPSSLTIYPNPSEGIFNISMESIRGDLQCKVFDLTGNEYRNFEFTGITGFTVKQLDLQDLPAGVYFISFIGRSFSMIEKIVIN